MLNSQLGKATREDFEYAIRVVQRLRKEKSTMYFQNLGNIKEWTVEAYRDA